MTISATQAQIAFDSTEIVIGSQTVLTVSHVDTFPSTDDLSQGALLPLRQWFDTAAAEQHTLFTCFEPGDHWLKIGDDSVLLRVRDVSDLDTNSEEIRDIAGIVAEPLRFWDVARWFVYLIALLAAIALGWYVADRIRKRQPIIQIPQRPPQPPHEIARAAIEQLRRKQLWQQGLVKAYHTELTDIVRQYIESRCGINSTEMTSDQTTEAFTHWWMQQQDRTSDSHPEQLLDEMLHTADMVKFAKSEPLPYIHDRSMDQAVTFIETLTPKPATHE